MWITFLVKSGTFNTKIIFNPDNKFVILQSFLEGSYKSYKVLRLKQFFFISYSSVPNYNCQLLVKQIV